MEKSLIIILMLTPGVIGAAFSAMLCGNSKPGTLSSNITMYFLYSAFSWILAEFIGPGYILSAILQNASVTIMQLFVPIIIAVCLSFLWVLWLKEFIVKEINRLYGLINRNEIFLEPALFEKVFGDNQPHGIEILKDGKTVAKGHLEHYQCNEKAFSVIDASEYSGYEEQNVRYLIYLDKDVIIREFTYKDLQ